MEKKINRLLILIKAILYLRFFLMNFVSIISLNVLFKLELNFLVIFFVILFVFILIFNLIFLVKRLYSFRKLKKIIKENEEKVNYELKSAFYVNYREYILTENYIVDLRCYKIINYNDIRFIYYQRKKSLISRDFPLVLTIITDKEKVFLIVWSSLAHFKEYYEDLESLIKTKNPNVIKCKKRDIKKLINKS